MRQGYAQVRNDVLQVIYDSKEPIDVNTIAKRVRVHWFTAYRAIMEIILDDIMDHHPEILDDLSVRPIKTTRGWVFAKPVRPARGSAQGAGEAQPVVGTGPHGLPGARSGEGDGE